MIRPGTLVEADEDGRFVARVLRDRGVDVGPCNLSAILPALSATTLEFRRFQEQS